MRHPPLETWVREHNKRHEQARWLLGIDSRNIDLDAAGAGHAWCAPGKRTLIVANLWVLSPFLASCLGLVSFEFTLPR